MVKISSKTSSLSQNALIDKPTMGCAVALIATLAYAIIGMTVPIPHMFAKAYMVGGRVLLVTDVALFAITISSDRDKKVVKISKPKKAKLLPLPKGFGSSEIETVLKPLGNYYKDSDGHPHPFIPLKPNRFWDGEKALSEIIDGYGGKFQGKRIRIKPTKKPRTQ